MAPSPTDASQLASNRYADAQRVYQFDPLRDSRWEAFVNNCSQSSVFHSLNWLRALRAVYEYDPIVVTTSPPNAPLTNGLVLCRVCSWLTGARFVSLPFSDHCEPLVSSSEELAVLLSYLRRYVDEEAWKYVELRPISVEPDSSTHFGKHLTYSFHRLNLNRSREDIFRSFHKDCVQRKIRRAEKEQLRYEEGTSEALLQTFYRLMTMTRRRLSLPPQPLDWFQGLLAAFGSNIKIRVASAGHIPVASIITLSHKSTMTYKYGCSDADFNKLGGMALLFWKTIQEAKADGYCELDLGRSDSDNLGLIAFKNHWGATETSITYWKYPQQPPAGLSFWQHKLVKRGISSMPRVVLRTLGKLLYKHIG